jgi:hypothetical protein
MRALGFLVLGFTLIVAVDERARGQESGGKKEKEEPRPIRKLEPIKKDRGQEKGDPAQEIIGRLHKNLDLSEERLGKQDPGTGTRRIQEDIVKDLDELIKEMNNQGNQGSSTSAARKKRSGQVGPKANPGGSAQNQPKGARGKESQGAAAQKGRDPKEGKGAGGQNVKASPRETKNTLADLFKDVWGHLPQTKRQEMDAYSRERLMPRYEDILRQYYRTISEARRGREEE